MNNADTIKAYYDKLRKEVEKAYLVAKKARSLGLDPEPDVEIPISNDMADRVQNIVSIVDPIVLDINLPKAIREIEKESGALSLKTILKIAGYVADEVYKRTKDKVKAVDLGLRAGFAYHTLGVVAAPTEGIVKVAAKKRRDGKEYIAVYYAGPVRSAGGTPAAFSVIIADYLRRKFGYEKWDPSEEEIQRYIVEVYDYKRVKSLQYTPKKEELEFALKNLPIEITGEPTEDAEVSGYKDLDRIETNRIRGGMALVLAEGLIQKAKKLVKKFVKKGLADEFGMSDWKWLADLKKLQEELYAKEESESKSEDTSPILPNWKYLSQITAGRPVIALPSKIGGFRVRYGKSRTNGLEAMSIHPATAVLTYNFLAWGTQMAVERPGKATVVTFSTTLEPPVVRLKDGSVIRVETEKQAKEIMKNNLLDKILFLGDILIPYGDFLDNGHILVPSGYVEEWWILDFEDAASKKVDSFKVEFDLKKPRMLFNIEGIDKLSEFLGIDGEFIEKLIKDPIKTIPKFEDALKISILLDTPLHPKYTYFWRNISYDEAIKLLIHVRNNSEVKIGDYIEISGKKIPIAEKIEINNYKEIKKILEQIYIPHKVVDDKILIKYPDSAAFYIQLGYFSEPPNEALKNGLEVIQRISIVKIRDKAGTCIGTRMGRPEKAKIREMKGSPMVLFPVGQEGGRMRNLIEVIHGRGKVLTELPIYKCKNCGRVSPYKRCPYCNGETVRFYKCRVCGALVKTKEHCGKPTLPYDKYDVDARSLLEQALKNLKLDASQLPKLIKGVRGLSSKEKIPERIEKGILRAAMGVFVFRDGTIRFDAIETPITYFKPKDLIYTSIEKLKELGYTHDIYGNPLEHEDQVLELKPQDIILPSVGPTKSGGKIKPNGVVVSLVNAARFIDELLVRFYKLEPYYNVRRPEDLIGHLIILMAPHTSAGTIGRIIGFSRTQTLLAHPLVHAAMRRNCDGDEGGFMLLLDALLNFSKHYLPAKRGGTMDAPLTITIQAKPMEVDDEVHSFDTVWNYPKELYEASLQYKDPGEVKIEILADRIGRDDEYINWGFMHDVDSISYTGNKLSSYKGLKNMLDKVSYQLKVAEVVEANDPSVVASLVIDLHFAKDVKGNLRRFSSQEFRCVKCNTKYRRVPLSGKCEECGGRLVFTVSQGTVTKYLGPSLELAEKLKLSEYIVSSLKVLKLRVDQTFGKNSKEKSITQFFNNTK